jgi:hypothetical protein
MLLASSKSAYTQQPHCLTCPQHTARCGQQDSSTSCMQLEYHSARLLILPSYLTDCRFGVKTEGHFTNGSQYVQAYHRAPSWPRYCSRYEYMQKIRNSKLTTPRLHCNINIIQTKQNKLHGLSPRANYTDRATAASRRSDCQLLRIKGATWSA